MDKKQSKKKKQKTVYIDDGRTIADMSQFSPRSATSPSSSTWRDKVRTYIDSVKIMFFPMLIVLALISVAFLLLYLLISLAV